MKKVLPVALVLTSLSGCVGGFGAVGTAAYEDGRPFPRTALGLDGQRNALAVAESLEATRCPRGMVARVDGAEVQTRTDAETSVDNISRFGYRRFERTWSDGERRVSCVPASQVAEPLIRF